MRSKFDSQDFVQAVWVSFFANVPTISRFDSPDALVAFLIRVASNKVIEECRRRLQGQKYNVNRERSLNSSVLRSGLSPKTNAPTPSEFAVANERWGQLTHGQSSRDMQILKLRADGATLTEIAEKLDVSERTIRRFIRRLSDQFVPDEIILE